MLKRDVILQLAWLSYLQFVVYFYFFRHNKEARHMPARVSFTHGRVQAHEQDILLVSLSYLHIIFFFFSSNPSLFYFPPTFCHLQSRCFFEVIQERKTHPCIIQKDPFLSQDPRKTKKKKKLRKCESPYEFEFIFKTNFVI